MVGHSSGKEEERADQDVRDPFHAANLTRGQADG
jgi:hypothetical protein